MQKIAFLVIHGIGDQHPFESMDAFVQPFHAAYAERVAAAHPGAQVRLKHCLTKFPGWVESYVAIMPDAPGFPEIHVYEYYWAYMTERQISAGEVCQWMVGVAKGAKRFYDRQKRASVAPGRPANDPLFNRDGEFQNYEYLARLLSMGNFFRFVYMALSPLMIHFRIAEQVLKYFIKGPLEKFMGDIAVYCSTDKKSKYYEARARILKGAKEKFAHLIQHEDYEKIFLAGHSLGTVVAYDTLARINRECGVDTDLCRNSAKIKGLFTFGSPLDKIAFFFDEQIPDEQYIRQAITSQLYGFRRVREPETPLESGVPKNFDKLTWLNFWSTTDPVSGHLDVYRGVENVPLDFSKKIRKGLNAGLDSHCEYWKCSAMYGRMIDCFLEGKK